VIVADASAIAELLLARLQAEAIRNVLSEHTEIHVPEHFHVEVLSVLRRYSIRRELSELRAAEALEALQELRTLTYPIIELTSAVWELRARLTTYDAAYLALAQQLDVPLITLDGGLAEAAASDGRLAALTG
jgi:predicted nucleic acid-binding protein